jgi:hypothetical protein
VAVDTDILVAHASEAKAILASKAHNQEWPSLEAKRLDTWELAGLLSILTGEPDDDDLLDEFTVEAEADREHGPWVYRLPDRLVDHLSALAETEIEPVAMRWADRRGVPRWMMERATVPPRGGLLTRLLGRARVASTAAEVERYREQTLQGTRWALTELRSLARTAKAEGKQLLLWIMV